MSQATRARTIGMAVVAAGLMVAWSSCYKPSVQSGGLLCAAGSKPCPDGFECIGGSCLSSAQGTGGAAGTGGHAGTPGSGGHVGTGGQVATGGGGQIGAGGVTGTGGAAPLRAVGETCTIINRGQQNQSDDCESNGICVDDCAQSACYRVCSGDGDCPGSSCSRTDGMSGTRFCEVPFVTCDPQDGMQGCDAPTMCYLLASTPAPSGGDQTVCDCASGGSATGEPCTESRQCFAGLLCPPAGMPGGGACRRVCDTTNLLMPGCPSGTICNAYGSKWGYCN